MSHHQSTASNSPYSSSSPSDGDSLRFIEHNAIAKRRTKPSAKSTLIGKTPVQVHRRNERERKRVQQLNNGYEVLRLQVSPWEKVQNKKLTKSQTLHVAIEYINYLQELLENTENKPRDMPRAIKREVVDSSPPAEQCHPGMPYSSGGDFAANGFFEAYASPCSTSPSGSAAGSQIHSIFDHQQFAYGSANAYYQPAQPYPYGSHFSNRPNCM
ncbi:Helix-loop-helix DNA-binding domain containing protein [Aphelenchoides avenae]|nr:Helix-loop-helix DNA-binding domain containing protein [Aphelenchus avenae]